MKNRLSTYLAALALSAAALPAVAVTFGVPDGNGHPHVGNILFERPEGYFSCTGTMMSPTVMLTAGHCNDFAGWPTAPTYDAGLIVLAKAVSMATYGELPSLGFLETIRSAAENNFTVVGYGLQGYIPAFYSDAWTRYVGTVKLLEANSTWTGGGTTAKFTNNPGTGGGTCFGDSGGPIFYGNTNIVVALVSWGWTPCIGTDFNFRTDIPTTQDFVDPYL